MTKLTDNAREKLGGKNLGFLATIMEDGSPHVAPVWVDFEGDHILVNTVAGRLKERNIRRDPRVALSVASREDFEDKVDFRGRVVDIVDGPEADEHIHALARKYRGTEGFDIKPGDKRLVLHIEPTVVHDGH